MNSFTSFMGQLK